jgi:hypothetical protein
MQQPHAHVTISSVLADNQVDWLMDIASTLHTAPVLRTHQNDSWMAQQLECTREHRLLSCVGRRSVCAMYQCWGVKDDGRDVGATLNPASSLAVQANTPVNNA